MIYIDTSVVLAQLLSSDVLPPADLWGEPVVSSRLLEYEAWTRVNRVGAEEELVEAARVLIGRVSFLELLPPVLERALDPWPSPVRTLDALHLASLGYLRDTRLDIPLATYDGRMRRCAAELGFQLYPLDG